MYFYLNSWMFEVLFQTATAKSRRTRAYAAQVVVVSLILFSIYLNDMPLFSPHIDLAVYA
jgi:hypothetical protein